MKAFRIPVLMPPQAFACRIAGQWCKLDTATNLKQRTAVTPEDITKMILLTPFVFIWALLFLPLDIWALPFRAIVWTWCGMCKALAWPVLALARAMSRKA